MSLAGHIVLITGAAGTLGRAQAGKAGEEGREKRGGSGGGNTHQEEPGSCEWAAKTD